MTTDLKDIPEVPVSLPPPRFANPFQGLKGDPTAATVNCVMPEEAFKRVKRCRLESGTIQTTMNHLWIKLIDLLEKKGINDYADVREFEHAVQHSVLVLPEDLQRIRGPEEASGTNVHGSPTSSVDPTANVGDVAGATEQLRSTTEGEPQQPDPPSDAGEGSSKRGKGKPKRSGKKG